MRRISPLSNFQWGTIAAAANAFVYKEREPSWINEDLESISRQLEDIITKQENTTQHPFPLPPNKQYQRICRSPDQIARLIL